MIYLVIKFFLQTNSVRIDFDDLFALYLEYS